MSDLRVLVKKPDFDVANGRRLNFEGLAWFDHRGIVGYGVIQRYSAGEWVDLPIEIEHMEMEPEILE